MISTLLDVQLLSCCQRVALLAVALPFLGSCASRPLDRPELQDLRDKFPPLARSVLLIIHATAAEPYGSRAQWLEDFERAFHELLVATDVSTLKDEAQVDLVVEISLAPTTSADPKILTQGALLDLLAWITVPLASLWIQDVESGPGLQYRLSRRLTGVDSEKWADEGARATSLPTCMLDRYHFISWPTLGALFVPPFVFSNHDPEHLPGATGSRVREEVAFRIAAIVKGSSQRENELLQNLRVTEEHGALSLAFNAAPGLRRLRISAEPPATPRQPPFEVNIPLENDGKALQPIPLAKLLSSSGPNPPKLFRIIALGSAGPPVSYTVAAPSTATPVTGGG